MYHLIPDLVSFDTWLCAFWYTRWCIIFYTKMYQLFNTKPCIIFYTRMYHEALVWLGIFLHEIVAFYTKWSFALTWYFFTQNCDFWYIHEAVVWLGILLQENVIFDTNPRWLITGRRLCHLLQSNVIWSGALTWYFFTASCNIWRTLSLHFSPELFCLSVANCSGVKCCPLFRRSVSRRHARTWRRWHKLIAQLMETMPRKLAMQSKEKTACFAVSMAPEWLAELIAAERLLEAFTSRVNPSGVVSHLTNVSADRQWCQGFSVVNVRSDTKNGFLDRIPRAVVSRAPAFPFIPETVTAAESAAHTIPHPISSSQRSASMDT